MTSAHVKRQLESNRVECFAFLVEGELGATQQTAERRRQPGCRLRVEALLYRLGEVLRAHTPPVAPSYAFDHRLELGEVELSDDFRPELLEVP